MGLVNLHLGFAVPQDQCCMQRIPVEFVTAVVKAQTHIHRLLQFGAVAKATWKPFR